MSTRLIVSYLSIGAGLHTLVFIPSYLWGDAAKFSFLSYLLILVVLFSMSSGLTFMAWVVAMRVFKMPMKREFLISSAMAVTAVISSYMVVPFRILQLFTV